MLPRRGNEISPLQEKLSYQLIITQRYVALTLGKAMKVSGNLCNLIREPNELMDRCRWKFECSPRTSAFCFSAAVIDETSKVPLFHFLVSNEREKVAHTAGSGQTHQNVAHYSDTFWVSLVAFKDVRCELKAGAFFCSHITVSYSSDNGN